MLDKIIISCGGTGGHIYPALAIAEEINRRYPETQILFIGARGRMEMHKVPAAGYPIKGLKISGLNRSKPWKNLGLPAKLLKSMKLARKLIVEFQPQLVVGTGGYASGPALQAASRLKIPILIQEQNSYPGLTNRWLGRKAKKVCVAFEGMESYFPPKRIVLTGNPIRHIFHDTHIDHREALSFFKLKKGKVVLVVGGSQGAWAINEAIASNIKGFHAENIQLIWQTGRSYIDQARKTVKINQLEDTVKVFEFIDRMDMAYTAANLVVSRAGAITIAELAAMGKASIFIPLPSAAADHQTKNAQKLVECRAAKMIKNEDAEKILLEHITALFNDPKTLAEMSELIKTFYKPRAVSDIVDEIEKLVQS